MVLVGQNIHHHHHTEEEYLSKQMIKREKMKMKMMKKNRYHKFSESNKQTNKQIHYMRKIDSKTFQ